MIQTARFLDNNTDQPPTMRRQIMRITPDYREEMRQQLERETVAQNYLDKKADARAARRHKIESTIAGLAFAVIAGFICYGFITVHSKIKQRIETPTHYELPGSSSRSSAGN